MNRSLSLLVLCCLFLAPSCAVKKKKGEASALGKAYHNVTAKYNGYFNANELLEQAFANLDNNYEDNFTQVLPVYRHLATTNEKSEAANLDKAIEKVSVVATIHRKSHWTDDCYLLMGKCYYLKKDYESAEQHLRFMTNEFAPQKAKKGKKAATAKKSSSKKKKEIKKKSAPKKKKSAPKKKKKKSSKKKKSTASKGKTTSVPKKESGTAPVKTEEKPKSGVQPDSKTASKGKTEEPEKKEEPKRNSSFFKHTPAYQEGLLWLARTLVERDKYEEAERILVQLEGDPRTPKEVIREVPVALAHLYIRHKQYAYAIEPLKRAIEQANNRKEKARYAYVLAQLFEQNRQFAEAANSYEKVIDLKPDYLMEFNARIHQNQVRFFSGSEDMAQVMRSLEKMQKDGKNSDYQEQVRFAMAQVALHGNDKDAAIGHLKAALENKPSSQSQRVETLLLLANLYYEKEDFLNTRNHLNQALTMLDKRDPRYEDCNKLKNNLEDIAKNISIIRLQDSLLVISRMDDAEKKKLAIKLREDRRKADQAKAAEQQATNKAVDALAQAVIAPNRPGVPGNINREKSEFFAYDERSVKAGKKDFEKIWGKRPLEDDWRRSNKRGAAANPVANNQLPTQPTAAESGAITDEEVKEILKDVPASPADITQANDKIRDALFALGKLYRDKLNNIEWSNKSFEELGTRYPNSKFEADAWYYLYLNYVDLGNQVKAKEYYDKIMDKYGNTTYAQVLRDPSFVAATLDARKSLVRFYDDTYAMFQAGKYQDAYNRVKEAQANNKMENSLRPRYALLEAMCIGSMQGKPQYLQALKELIAKYPNTQEEIRAKEILRLLGDESVFAQDKTAKKDVPGGKDPYAMEEDGLHFGVVQFNSKDVSLNDAKNGMVDFHDQFFRNNNLKISSVFLDVDVPLLVIRKFANRKEAMDYYRTAEAKKDKLLDGRGKLFRFYVISQNNYRTLLRNKEIGDYKDFFEESYLKNE